MRVTEPDLSTAIHHGVRRDVFNALARADATLTTDFPPVVAGKVRLNSSTRPHIQGEKQYSINVTQKVTWPNVASPGSARNEQDLTSTQRFVVKESPWQLEDRLIHSVYPPPGHAEYSNVLPHVLLNSHTIPWSIQPTSGAQSDSPWLAVLSFTEDELLACDAALYPALTALSSVQTSAQIAVKSPTLATTMSLGDLGSLHPATVLASTGAQQTDNPTTDRIQVIFLQPSLFNGLFTAPDGAGVVSLSRFENMCSVREVDSSGMTGRSANAPEAFSSVVGPRTGPLSNARPEVVHAHLVSLRGVVDNCTVDPNNTKPLALVSLHSWSYTCLPSGGVSIHQLFRSLGKTVQPLRGSDALLARSPKSAAKAKDWAKNRILGGYSLLQYRSQSGASTLAFHRGPLSPFKSDFVEVPSSNFGTDLAIADRHTGFLDLSFQLAWELGKLLMSSDRSTAAALTRLRRDHHVQALSQAKIDVAPKLNDVQKSSDILFMTKDTAFEGLSNSAKRLCSLPTQDRQAFNVRWGTPESQNDERKKASFGLKATSVNNRYRELAKTQRPRYSLAVPAATAKDEIQLEPFNELNAPLSTDFAKVLAWCMDSLFFKNIPFHYLIPDPAYVPKETIRTFYLDHNWFRAFIDGATSVTEHFTEGDEVRESIKQSIEDYLYPTDNATKKPTLPKWGFFMRSQLVTKFADMRITAPRSKFDNKMPEVIRKEVLDVDLLVALFEREPSSDQFPGGITIHGPEHQLSNMIGEMGDVTDSQVTFRWKPLTLLDEATGTTKKVVPWRESTTFTPQANDPMATEIFDFKLRSLKPQGLTAAAGDMLFAYDRTGWTATADSYEDVYQDQLAPASNVLDGNPDTIWHTKFSDPVSQLPHSIYLDMKQCQMVSGLVYIPRQSGTFNGTIGRYAIETTKSSAFLDGPVATGTWSSIDREPRIVRFAPVMCKFVRFTALSEVQGTGNPWTSCSEIYVLGPPPSYDSLLASQLVNVVPKLTLKSFPASQSSSPSTLKLIAKRHQDDKRRNNEDSKTTPQTRVSIDQRLYIPPTPPPGTATPTLAAMARVDLDLTLDDDNKIWSKTFSPKLGNADWNGGAAVHAPSSPSDVQPKLALNIFNLRARSYDPSSGPRLKRGIFACAPSRLGLRTDLHFVLDMTNQAAISDDPQSLWVKYVSLEITIPVNDTVSDGAQQVSGLLLPFPTTRLPLARPLSKRWIAKTAMPTTDTFVVTLTPNVGDPTSSNPLQGGRYWEFANVGQMGFVLHDVLPNSTELSRGPLYTEVKTKEVRLRRNEGQFDGTVWTAHGTVSTEIGLLQRGKDF